MPQLGEALDQVIAARAGVEYSSNVKDTFHTIRKLGNDANHQFNSSAYQDALAVLQLLWVLFCWFHKTLGQDLAKNFNPGKFVKPQYP